MRKEALKKAAAAALSASLLLAAAGPETARAAVVAAASCAASPAAFPAGAAGAGILAIRGPSAILPSGAMETASLHLPSPSGWALRRASRASIAAGRTALPIIKVAARKNASGAPALQEALSSRVAAARKGQGIPAALGRWFDNSKGLSPAEEAVPAAESAPSSGLSRGASREIHPPAVPAPRQSLLRSARAGLVVGVIGVALEYAIHFTALFLGYQFHPSYRGVQTIVISSLWDVARVASSSAIFMPIAEEVVFRAGLIGVFSWLGAKVADNKLMKVYLPALAGSLVFVGLHENADPLSFGIRLVLSLLLSAVYQKEGLMASIAAHMTNNLIPTAGIVGQWLLGPGAWGWQTFLILGAFAALAYKALKAEGPSGSARAVTPREALILAALTLAGIFLASLSIKTVIVCSIAAALLLAYAKAAGTRKWRKPA